MVFAHGTAWGRYEQRRAYQESPLSPLATPLTATLTTTLPVTQSLLMTVPVTVPVTVPMTETAPAPVTVQITSPLTVTVTEVVPTPVVQTPPTTVERPVATAALVDHGQVSLFLVGAVLASILVVIVVVLVRQR